MKILVTGGAGYIGCELVSELLQRGHAVKVFDKLLFGNPLDTGGGGSRVEMVQGDIREIQPDVLEGVRAVIHLAGMSNDPTAEFNPEANMAMNRDGTSKLAEACVQAGINRFTYASSASIYDRGLKEGEDELQDEETPVEPIAAYSTSKFEGEKVLLDIAKSNDGAEFNPVVLRQGTVYGLSPRMRYDLVVNTMVRSAFTNGRIKAFCGGTQWRPLVDVRDVARAHIACLEADPAKVGGEVFNVVQDNYQMGTLAHIVKEAIKDYTPAEVDVDFTPGRIDRSYRLSGRKMEDVLGFRYTTPVADSAKNIAYHIKQHLDRGGNTRDLHNPEFSNIKWMEHLVEMQERLEAMGGSVF